MWAGSGDMLMQKAVRSWKLIGGGPRDIKEMGPGQEGYWASLCAYKMSL